MYVTTIHTVHATKANNNCVGTTDAIEMTVHGTHCKTQGCRGYLGRNKWCRDTCLWSMEYPVEDLHEATIDRQRGSKKAQAER